MNILFNFVSDDHLVLSCTYLSRIVNREREDSQPERAQQYQWADECNMLWTARWFMSNVSMSQCSLKWSALPHTRLANNFVCLHFTAPCIRWCHEDVYNTPLFHLLILSLESMKLIMTHVKITVTSSQKLITHDFGIRAFFLCVCVPCLRWSSSVCVSDLT